MNGYFVLNEDPRHMVRFLRTEGDKVVFHPADGGFQMRLDHDKFEERYRPATEADNTERSRRRPAKVTGDWFQDTNGEWLPPLPAYVTGRTWNGWAMPAFTKETVLDASDDQRLLGIWYCERHDMFVQITEGATAVNDREALADLVARENGYVDQAINGHEVVAEGWTGFDIEVDGETVHVYDVGAGSWCWSLDEEGE